MDFVFVPNLDPVDRDREFNNCTQEQRDTIVYNFLFVKGVSNRKIDEQILGLDSDLSKGWQSMGVLHHLGIKNPHKGIFIGFSIDHAINVMSQQNLTHFKTVIDSISRYQKSCIISQVFDSWELFDNNIALKTIDKSTFAHSGTGVPFGVRDFFEIGHLGKREKKELNLFYDDSAFFAYVQMDTLDTPRSRLFWKADFRDLLMEEMPSYYDLFINGSKVEESKLPKIRFTKVNGTRFNIDFVYPIEIEEDIVEEIDGDEGLALTEVDPESRREGKVRYIYGKQYERDQKNRVEAIKYHGTKCTICQFDFEKVYGLRGKGFIEIHHLNPLSSVGKETDINPKTDLVPVCSNCHKMIHRRKDNVLSIEQMKMLIKK